MDEKKIKEMMIDFETILSIINKHLTQLKQFLNYENNNLENIQTLNLIDNQQNEVRNKIEEIRKQTMMQIQNSMKSINIPNIPMLNMPNVPNMSMPNIPNMPNVQAI